MLNFDPERFVAIQSGAVALARPIRETIAGLLAEGAENVFFLGSGGAGILMQPAYDLIRRSSTFPTYLELNAEILEGGSAHLGAKSIVIVPSLSGTTQESLDIISYAKERGATVLSFTGNADSPIARSSDTTFTNAAADDTSSESFFVQSLLVALAIMAERGERSDFDELAGQLEALPAALLAAKEQFEERASELAQQIAGHENYHIVTGAGNTWAEAYYYGMCILEEMQWIRTRPVHASDFFHGTLELVEKGVSILAVKGEDSSRPLIDRLEAFAPQVTDGLMVIDTQDFALEGIGTELRGLISPAVIATAFERLSAHLESVRRHPLTVRRYYRRIAY